MNSYTCPRCGKTAFPGFVLANSGKLIVECPDGECRFQDASLTPADFNTGIAAVPSDSAAGPGWGGKSAVVVAGSEIAMPPAAVPMAPSAPRAGTSSFAPHVPSRAPGDVIAWIQERTQWLGAEEARLEGEIASARASLAGVRAESRRLSKMLRVGRASAPTAPAAPAEHHLNGASARVN